jgi:hypothetical protein
LIGSSGSPEKVWRYWLPGMFAGVGRLYTDIRIYVFRVIVFLFIIFIFFSYLYSCCFPLSLFLFCYPGYFLFFSCSISPPPDIMNYSFSPGLRCVDIIVCVFSPS